MRKPKGFTVFLFYCFAYSSLSLLEELNICIAKEAFFLLRPPLLWLSLEKKKKKQNLKDSCDLACDNLALYKDINQILAGGNLD